MMDHEAYRRALLSDPQSEDAELLRHRESCSACAEYTQKLLRFESRLQRALQLKLPAPAAGFATRRFAMAASVLLALVAAGAVWLAVPRDSLAADVVAHMADEPDAWNTRAALPDPKLNAVLLDADMHLAPGAGVVSYASSCEFRGHVVPHLVVQSASGPVTVMVLVHESVGKPVRFDEHGYRGIIVPVAGHGSLALLMREPDAEIKNVEEVAARVRAATVWSHP